VEDQSEQDKQAGQRLQSLLSSAEQQLRSVHMKFQEDRNTRQTLEMQLQGAKHQEMMDAEDVERMDALLAQALDKLTGAQASILVAKQQKEEQEERLHLQRSKRAAAEKHELELVSVMQVKMREEDERRKVQEQTLLELESQRRLLEAKLDTQRELVRGRSLERAQVVQRKQRAEEQLAALVQDNERMKKMLQEAEESCGAIHNATLDTQQSNQRLERQNAALEEQARQRQVSVSTVSSYVRLVLCVVYCVARPRAGGRHQQSAAHVNKQTDKDDTRPKTPTSPASTCYPCGRNVASLTCTRARLTSMCGDTHVSRRRRLTSMSRDIARCLRAGLTSRESCVSLR
jgi:hypothetical protein